MDTIDPGSTIHVKIVKQPTNAAAAKTLVRLLSKDAAMKKEVKRLSQTRKTGARASRRGGRNWQIRMVKQHRLKGNIGESGTIAATPDVLRDLENVSRFIQVQIA